MTATASSASLPKTPTGIAGFDKITGGGLPKGRPSLICGSAGCGKTLFAMEFLVRGATEFNEPGVFMAFEETTDDLAKNVASLGFDLHKLVSQKKIALDFIHIEKSQIEETGEYDLEGLFIRLDYAIKKIGAKRVVLDTLEALFSGLSNTAILRAELRRLFVWLKERGVTAVITGERGEGELTRQGLEEYVSDCVVLLDHRIADQVSTRRLRVIKYRGSVHGTNEYPFLIDEQGISVLPITALSLDHKISTERISTGVPRLDAMLEGKGFYRGSSILISGTPGSGKTSLATTFAESVCRRGQTCAYFAFEESPQQIIRNMASINLDLSAPVKKGLLKFHASRPTLHGLEMHLVTIHKMIEELNPGAVIIDPISNFISVGTKSDVTAMLLRLIDYLKSRQITALFTTLTNDVTRLEMTEQNISSLMDTWIFVRDLESNGERNRGLYVLKSRGMGHSNQVREFRITSKGVELLDVPLGPGGALVGSARVAQESEEKMQNAMRRHELERKKRALEARRLQIKGQIQTLQLELSQEEKDLEIFLAQDVSRTNLSASNTKAMAKQRKADAGEFAMASSNGRSK